MSTREQLAISALIDTKEITPFLDAGITEAFFYEQRWRESWRWTYQYWQKHGSVPNAAAYVRRFPSYKLISDIEDPISGLIEELRDKHKRTLVQDGLAEAINSFDTVSTDDTLVTIQKIISTVNLDVSSTQVIALTATLGEFISNVINRPPMELLGIPTGFPTIDEATGGLQPEQLITLVGPPKRGKSNIGVAIGLTAAFHGYKVGIVSFEMSNDEIRNRILCIGAGVGLTPIMRGQLTTADHSKLWQFEADLADSGGEVILIHDIASASTVGMLAAKIEQHKPDLLIVDGAYMMEDEEGEPKGSPRALTNITRSMKRLAQRSRIPLFVTTQALLSRVSKKGGVQMDSIGYTSSFAQDSDVLLGIDRDDLSQPKAKLKVIAGRSALGVETDIIFDLSVGYVAEEVAGSTMRPRAGAEDAADEEDGEPIGFD